MQAKNRSPARFVVEGYSAAFKCKVEWKVEVGGNGITARRAVDGRELSITWRELLGAALVYGRDASTSNGKGGKL